MIPQYFPLEIDAANDPKIRAAARKYGKARSFGVFFLATSEIYRSNGYIRILTEEDDENLTIDDYINELLDVTGLTESDSEVLNFFFSIKAFYIEDNAITNNRVLEELDKQCSKSKSYAERAKKGGLKAAENRKTQEPIKGKATEEKPLRFKKNNDDINEIFEFWAKTMGKNLAIAKLTPKREKAITCRLKEGDTKEQIKTAIVGCRKDDFSMGKNDNRKKDDDIELFCRTGEKLESFIEVKQNNNNNQLMAMGMQ